MRCRYYPQLLVDCVISFSDDGLTGEAQVLDYSFPACPRPSDKELEPGDYVQLRLHLPDREKPVRVPLGAIRWTGGPQFGVEVILIDADDEIALKRLLARHSSIDALSDWREEIVLTAAVA